MALLDRAVRLLGPGHLPPRWRADVIVSQTMDAVPAWVWHEFQVHLRSFEPLVADSREHQVITGALTRWKQDRHGTVALLGTFGAGKTSLLHRIQVTLRDLPVAHHRFASRILGQNQLLQQLADSLGLPPPGDLDDLAAHLQAGPEQAILLDWIAHFRLATTFRSVAMPARWSASACARPQLSPWMTTPSAFQMQHS